MVIELLTVNLDTFNSSMEALTMKYKLSLIFCENADTGNFILIRAQTRYKSIEILFPVSWW